jgi:hypothetical protein
MQYRLQCDAPMVAVFACADYPSVGAVGGGVTRGCCYFWDNVTKSIGEGVDKPQSEECSEAAAPKVTH